MESIILLTTIEHYLIIIAIKLMLISELMLFISCFWCVINIRFMSSPLSLFCIIPFISCNAFSIPFSNLIILLYSSYPLNGSQLALKTGDLLINITLLKTSISFAVLFIILQLKEFLYSFFSLSDCIIGSISYFTTGLHGIHVLFGSFSLFIISYNTLYTINLYYIEFTSSLYLTSFYWHFVDLIWFLVFLFLVVLIIVLIN